MLNILDIVIVMFILMGGILGMKRGVIKQGVLTIGMIVVLVLSFLLKNPVSKLMYTYLPFFTFGGLLKDISSLNILLYEVIAFSLVFGILSALLIVLIKISSILQKIIKYTIVLSLPSKILGFVLGIVEYYLIVFIILFILSTPAFNINQFDFVYESNLKNIVLEDTFGISSITSKTLDTFRDVNKLIKNKDDLEGSKFNCEVLDVMIKNKFLDKESAKYLYKTQKIDSKCNINLKK